MESHLNKELEDILSNDASYEFIRLILMSDPDTKRKVGVAQNYGLTEKQAVLMFMELTAISPDTEGE